MGGIDLIGLLQFAYFLEENFDVALGANQELGPRTHVEGLQEQAERTVVLHPSTVLCRVSLRSVLKTQLRTVAVQQESKINNNNTGPNLRCGT